jgi:hypothetical protein
MQPTYLPWLGYFDLMDQSDAFVFLDSVQFEKQSWQQRNRIVVNNQLHWLSIPVAHSGNSKNNICEMEVVYSAVFPKKQIRTIEQNYSQSPYFNEYFPELSAILESREEKLSVLNEKIINWMAGALGIRVSFIKSSEMQATGQRSELLVAICKELGSRDYLSPIGSVGYLLEDRQLFEKTGITLSIQHYNHPCYHQKNTPFVPFASSLDLLFNEGSRSLEIIRSGRRTNLSLQEASAVNIRK